MAYDVTKVKTPEDLARAAGRLCQSLRRSLAILNTRKTRVLREIEEAEAELNELKAQPHPDPAAIAKLEARISDLNEQRLALQDEILSMQELIDEFC